MTDLLRTDRGNVKFKVLNCGHVLDAFAKLLKATISFVMSVHAFGGLPLEWY